MEMNEVNLMIQAADLDRRTLHHAVRQIIATD